MRRIEKRQPPDITQSDHRVWAVTHQQPKHRIAAQRVAPDRKNFAALPFVGLVSLPTEDAYAVTQASQSCAHETGDVSKAGRSIRTVRYPQNVHKTPLARCSNLSGRNEQEAKTREPCQMTAC